MTERERLEAKIEQNTTDRSMLIDEYNKLHAKLAILKKLPKRVGVGDIWDSKGYIYVTGKVFLGNKLIDVCINGDGEVLTNIGTGWCPDYPIIGNIKTLIDKL